MRIQSTRPAPRSQAKPVDNGFDPHHEPYHGPKDGLSHPRHRWLLRPTLKAASALAYRKEIEGADKIPHEGGTLYCPHHPGGFDAIITDGLTPRDLRYMAAVQVFESPPLARVAEWMGAFPVNQDHASRVTYGHSLGLLKEGKGLVVFPEGGPPETPGVLNPLYTGAARLAISGKAEKLVPIAFHFKPDTAERPWEELGGLALAGLTAGAVVAGSLSGVPGLVQGAAALGGAVTGAFLGGTIGHRKLKSDNLAHGVEGLAGALGGGALGGVLGGVAGVAASAAFGQPAGIALGVLAGCATAGMAGSYIHRPIAQVKVGEPFSVAEYAARGKRTGTYMLTEDLHTRLGKDLSSLSGVPYDDDATKLAD